MTLPPIAVTVRDDANRPAPQPLPGGNARVTSHVQLGLDLLEPCRRGREDATKQAAAAQPLSCFALNEYEPANGDWLMRASSINWVDLIVRTPKNLKGWLEAGDSFHTEVVSKGRVLYEKTDAGVGPQS